MQLTSEYHFPISAVNPIIPLPVFISGFPGSRNDRREGRVSSRTATNEVAGAGKGKINRRLTGAE